MMTISPKVRRILLVAAAILVSLLLVAGAGIAWLGGTEAGLRFVVGQGTKRSPMPVTIGRIEGRLFGAMRFGGIELNSDSTRIRLASVAIDWNPPELLARRVHVRSLVLDGIDGSFGPAKADTTKEPEALKFPDVELPITIQVDSIRVRNITLRLAGRPDSFTVKEIALDGLRYRDSLGVQRFSLATPLGELGFHGWIRTRGRYPLDLAIQWTLRPPEFPVVTGGGTITGGLDTLTIEQTVTAPAKLFARVRLDSVLTRQRFDAYAKLEPLDVRTIRKDLPAMIVGGEVRADGTPARQAASVSASVATKEYGAWNADASGTLAGSALELTNALVAQKGGRARVTAKGTANLDPNATRFDLSAAWTDLAWPIVGEPQVRAPRGTLAFGGHPAAWEVGLETSLATRGHEERLTANGRGDTTSFTLDELHGTLFAGTVDAGGRVTWKPDVTWTADATLAGIDAGVYAPEWPSNLGARVATEGSMRGDAWRARVDVDELAGTLREKPVSGHVHFDGRKGGASTVDAELGYASAKFAATGSALSPIAIDWTLEAPALDELDSLLAGKLIGSGTVSGGDTLESVRAHVEGSGLAFAGASVENLDLEAELDHTRADAIDVELRTGKVVPPGVAPFDSVRVTLAGTRSGYDFSAAVESAFRRLSTKGRAAQKDSAWAGQLDELTMQVAKNAPWNLASPAPFVVGPHGGSFGPLSWRAGPASLDANADWHVPGDVRAEAKLLQFPLSNLDAFLPDSVTTEGSLTLDARALLRQDGVLDADVKLTPAAGKVTVRAPDPVDIEFRNLTFALTSNAQGLTGNAGAEVPELGTMKGEWSLPGFRWNKVDSTQSVRGDIEAELSKWALVERLSPEVRNIKGSVRADLDVAGTIGVPVVTGQAKLENGACDLPTYGLELRDIALAASGDGSGRWTLESSLASKPGQLAIKADANLANVRHARGTLQVKGTNFQAIHTEEADVRVSPDLDIQFDLPRVDVKGQLTVPHAKVNATNQMLAMAVPPSKDVIVPRAVKDTTEIPFDLYTDVRITLGDEVSFKGYGIAAEPEGTLRVTQAPNKPALAQGELSLKTGTYNGYGRDLSIERGRLIFAGGPVDDPEVNIRASREIKDADVDVGFEVKGTLKQTELTVFSDPEMSQSDAISYLLFNRPISEAKSSESSIARETATSLGLQAGSAYTNKLGQKVGLAEAGLESEGTIEEASLMLGTYLTPSLYARYGIGLFDSANTFQLSYFLNKHWTVKAESSDENRAGILYTIEPGRKSGKEKKK